MYNPCKSFTNALQPYFKSSTTRESTFEPEIFNNDGFFEPKVRKTIIKQTSQKN